eukprot:245706_1
MGCFNCKANNDENQLETSESRNDDLIVHVPNSAGQPFKTLFKQFSTVQKIIAILGFLVLSFLAILFVAKYCKSDPVDPFPMLKDNPNLPDFLKAINLLKFDHEGNRTWLLNLFNANPGKFVYPGDFKDRDTDPEPPKGFRYKIRFVRSVQDHKLYSLKEQHYVKPSGFPGNPSREAMEKMKASNDQYVTEIRAMVDLAAAGCKGTPKLEFVTIIDGLVAFAMPIYKEFNEYLAANPNAKEKIRFVLQLAETLKCVHDQGAAWTMLDAGEKTMYDAESNRPVIIDTYFLSWPAKKDIYNPPLLGFGAEWVRTPESSIHFPPDGRSDPSADIYGLGHVVFKLLGGIRSPNQTRAFLEDWYFLKPDEAKTHRNAKSADYLKLDMDTELRELRELLPMLWQPDVIHRWNADNVDTYMNELFE